jgi:hypothetical protein
MYIFSHSYKRSEISKFVIITISVKHFNNFFVFMSYYGYIFLVD